MATYGVDIRNGNPRQGFISFSGWTPTLGPNQSPPSLGGGTSNGFIQFNGQTQNDDRISKAFRKVGVALKINKQIFQALVGQAVGTVSGPFTYKWVKGTSGDNYKSLRQIDDFSSVFPARATTGSDQTAFRNIFQRTTFPAVYPKDVSGNGGGGKVRF